MTPAIPAATLILLRDVTTGPPQILMVERARTMAFAGGAMVFPGGRIDPGDHALAEVMGDPDLAQRLAAIRETIEEVGVAIGMGRTTGEDVAAMRAALAEGATLGGLGAVDPSPLVPYARWRPDHLPSRVFDTWFYIARLPDDAPDATVDATENVRALWTTAQGALDAASRGEGTLLFPTRRVLERLATHDDSAAAFAAAAEWPVQTITPYIEIRDGAEWLCIPDGLGYPVTAERLDDVVRG